MVKDNHLTYIDENGEEVLCEILFTYHSDEFNKDYVLFYPVGSEEEDEIEVLAASYTPDPEGDGIGKLHDIETDEEWAMIEELLEQFEADQEFYDPDFDEDYDYDEDEDYDYDDYEVFEDDEDDHDDDCGC